MKILKVKSLQTKKNSDSLRVNNFKKDDRYFSPSNVEWSNNIYSYNKNGIKSIFILNKVIQNLIKSYLNMYNTKAEGKLKIKRYSKRRRYLSSTKLWLSKIGLKHTNDTVIINLYIYDRFNNIILYKLKKAITKVYKSYSLKRKPNKLNNEGQIKPSNFYNNFINKIIIKLNKRLLNETFNNRTIETKFLNLIKIVFKGIKAKFLRKILKKEMNILYYKKFLWLNSLKYKNFFLTILQKSISRILNKKIIFNMIYLKNFYLNSDILTQILIHKSKDRNKSTYRILSRGVATIKTPLFRKNLINRVLKKKYLQNIVFKLKNDNKPDKLNAIIIKHRKEDAYNIEHSVLNSLKNKLITGVRLEAAGRLTKRFTAQRAIKVIKYVGTIKNIDSSFKGIPTQVLRNTLNNNLQYSKISSENRIGSFGLKGWIGSI